MKFSVRKTNKCEVISAAPSVNLTQIGNAIVPIPYPVSQKLGKAKNTANKSGKKVKFAGDYAYHNKSNSKSVKGDGKGSKKGIKSGTVEAKSEPITGTSVSSVKINKQPMVIEGKLQKMQGGNTIGKITCSDSGSGCKISDDGKIEGDTLPSDMDGTSAKSAFAGAGKQASRQAMARTTKPTAGGGAGGLGSLFGSPVVLQSGQLMHQYDYSGTKLEGALEIKLSLTYLSDQNYKGFFGKNRRFSYEKQFEKLASDAQGSTYRLFLENAQEFDFVQTDTGFVDTGNLGAQVWREGDTLVL
jgi:hypothetical protein